MSKLPYSGNIVQKNKGFVLPDEVTTRLFQKFKSTFGMAYASNGEILTIVSPDPADIAEFNTLQEAMKDQTVTFYFGSVAEASFPKEICQPFVLFNTAQDKAACVAYVDGEFEAFHNTQSNLSREFNFVTEFLKPELSAEYMRLGNNIDKLFGHLKEPREQKKYELLCAPRGAVMLLGNTGEIIYLGKNQKSVQYDWGCLSDSMGFNKDSFITKASSAVKSLLDRVTPAGTKPIASTAPIQQPEVPKLPEKVADVKADTAIAAQMRQAVEESSGITYKDREVPAGMNEKNTKSWAKANLGHTPEGWKTAKMYRIFLDKDGKKIKIVDHRYLDNINDPKFKNAMPDDLATATAAAAKDTKSASPPQNKVTPATPAKDTAPRNIPQPTQPSVADKEEVFMMVPAEERMDIVEKFLNRPVVKKAIGDGREEILHPKEVKSLEGETPDFFAQHGMQGPEDVLQWDGVMWNEFVQTYPNGVVSVILSLTKNTRKLNHELSVATAAPAKVEETAPKNATAAATPAKTSFAPRVPLKKVS